ncbi:hypothetical protein SAMN05192553_101722 [Cyclobacterium xiamenense]|uniref:Right handed beta helix region n=1 Tax=Cyclobacterium xiamenense TaxID=1297121 RepID=A0A1H6UEK7_9BACT|nr:hypothetical protein [Cyclobacterium xiamenense]SEI89104.1 hypothetical protein SAMN05192553_101722 [Cyclobacterium xiamenense]
MKPNNSSFEGILYANLCLFFLFFCSVSALNAQDGVISGEFVVEPPTLLNLGFEWKISGDENRNAKVAVSYRKEGSSQWLKGMPLLRIGGEKIFREAEQLAYIVPHQFAGSILDLEPGITYACRFELSDPDGVSGTTLKEISVTTRTVPKAYEQGRTLHVYPPGFNGEKIQPAFEGLKQAYYGSGLGDWSVVSERTVQPGDIILVHAGTYKADLLDYVDPHGIPFDGTYVLNVKATEEKPIVIRGAGDGAAIFDGNGAHRLFDVMGTQHHIFENLTFRNTDIVFAAGTKGVVGASNLTIRNCRMEDVGLGLISEFAGSRDFYVADNVILGRDPRNHLVGWANPAPYPPSPLKSYMGIKVYGSGHVICHNAVAFFHDGINVSTYGTPEESQDLKAVSIDIYNNDLHLMVDDFIEADGGVHNIRIMRNRGVNSGQCALSAQPVFGGPAYFIRNVVYHIPNGFAFKFMAKPAGLIVYHNTIIAENRNTQTFSNAHFRNNLFMGTDVPGRPVNAFPFATAYSTSDYNGYRPNPNTENHFLYLGPGKDKAYDYELSNEDLHRFSSLEALHGASGLEANGVLVGYEVFNEMTAPDPENPHGIYHAEDLNFTLHPSGKAVDKGTVIPNINDQYSGKAPDLGALEAGDPPPIYGPRSLKDRNWYR